MKPGKFGQRQLSQMHHPATMGPRHFTDVDRDLNVFRFRTFLIFMGVGYHPQPSPNLEDQGITLLVSTL